MRDASLMEGCLPECQKRVVIRPEIRKPGIDPESINHYRPVSNLMFLYKVIEQLVVRQLLRYLELCNLMSRPKTFLLRLISDVCNAIDAGHVMLLAFMDVSAAFNAVEV